MRHARPRARSPSDSCSRTPQASGTPRLVPASARAPPCPYEPRPATRPITIRQLLTHTSGIGYSWSDPGLALVQKKTGAADLDLPLVNEPGAQWTYGASTRVLGMVIEKISGLTIDKYLEARILGPLGMKDTTYAVPSSKTARVVSRNQRTDGKIVEIPNP